MSHWVRQMLWWRGSQGNFTQELTFWWRLEVEKDWARGQKVRDFIFKAGEQQVQRHRSDHVLIVFEEQLEGKCGCSRVRWGWVRTSGGNQATKVLLDKTCLLLGVKWTWINVDWTGVTLTDMLRMDFGGQGLKQEVPFWSWRKGQGDWWWTCGVVWQQWRCGMHWKVEQTGLWSVDCRVYEKKRRQGQF